MQSMLQNRKEATLKRELALAYAFSNQIWPPAEEQFSNGNDENISSSSYDQRENAKIVEIDTSQPYTYSPSNFQKTRNHRHFHEHQNRPYSPSSISSPWTEKSLPQSSDKSGRPIEYKVHTRRSTEPHPSSDEFDTHVKYGIHTRGPIDPRLFSQDQTVVYQIKDESPCESKYVRTIPGHSDSPRWPRKDQNMVTSHTPTLRNSAYCHRTSLSGNSAAGALPNYMVATASANARRSYSTPRQRPSTPEREKIKGSGSSAKKRLSFPDPDRCSEGGISDFDLDHTSSDEITSTSIRDSRRWLR